METQNGLLNASSLDVCAQWLSRVQLFATLWTVAHQAPLSMGFFRQEYWSGLPFPPLGDLPDPGITPVFPALAGDSLLLSHQGSAALSPLRRKFSTANLSAKSNLFGFHMGPQFFKVFR